MPGATAREDRDHNQQLDQGKGATIALGQAQLSHSLLG